MASVKLHLAKSTINSLPIIGDHRRPIPCVAWHPDQPGPDEPLLIWDDQVAGFHLLVPPGGARTFYLHGRDRAGAQYKVKIGRFGDELSAEQARAEAKRLRGLVAIGRNPAAERREARRAQRLRQAAPSTSELWSACLEAHRGVWAASTVASYAGWMKCHVLPALGKRKAHEVEPADVRRLYRSIVEHKPATADQVLRATSRIFSWAVGSDDYPLITVNPCAGALDRSSRGPGANKRVRYPVNDELPRLVDTLRARGDLLAKFFLLALLTGCRRGELLSAKWSDFDLDSSAPTWIKPASATKQKRLHRLPLNAEAVALLREVKALSPFAPFAGVTEERLYTAWRQICTASAIDDLRVHDLRHWAASIMVSAGLSLELVGGLLGHADPGVSSRYSHLSDRAVREASAKVGEVIALAGRKP
jgi:integrase